MFSESPKTMRAKMIPYTGSIFIVSITVYGLIHFITCIDAIKAYAVQADANIIK